MSNPRMGLTALNNAKPQYICDVLRMIAGPELAFGDLLNAIIKKVNSFNALAAKANVVIAGVKHTGDTITVTVDGTAVAYEVVAGDGDLHSVAENVAAAINADATVGLLVKADAVGETVFMEAIAKGTDFNGTTLAVAVTGADNTTTATRSAATFTGGAADPDAIPVIIEGDTIL